MSPSWLPLALSLLCTDHDPAPRVVASSALQPVATVAWTISVADSAGRPLEVRGRVHAVGGGLFPTGRDTTLLAHLGSGGHFYIDRVATLHVPPGEYDLMLGRGFEWKARSIRLTVASDTTTTHTLTRSFDLRPEGWYSGDVHAHAKHPPLEYPIGPAEAMRVARSEDLAVTHLLDQWEDFTGAPHAISDSANVLYMSYEHRNQTYGHAVLPGLRQAVTDVCCLQPQPPYPTLLDLAASVRASGHGLVVLGHPRTTTNYSQANGWPGAGHGRELPVLLAHGALDAIDVVSYSNDPDTLWQDWYDALSAGFHLPPSAGSDAVLNWHNHSPPGGWRVYANLGPGAPLDYDAWLAAFDRGRTFVTGYPLIPTFEVNGVSPGDTLDVTRDSVTVEIRWRARCAIELKAIRLIANGECRFERPTPSRPTQHDTTFTIRVGAPGWLALQVSGIQGFIHAAPAIPVAHTAAVWLQRGGLSRRDTRASARWLDELDVLQAYVLSRGGWTAPWQRDSVQARIERSRATFASAFVAPPSAFHLLEPAGEGEPASQLAWTPASDPEPGDRVRYRVRVSLASTGALVLDSLTSATRLIASALVPGERYVATISALDLSGQGPLVSPGVRTFVHALPPSLTVEPGTEARMRAWPNPVRGSLMIAGAGDDAEILDMAGRRIAWLGAGLQREGGALRWTHAHDGNVIPPGIYLARERGSGRTLRIVRLEGR